MQHEHSDPRDVRINLKWLKNNGYGHASTIWRKRRAGVFPEPDYPDDCQWSLATIREYNASQRRK